MATQCPRCGRTAEVHDPRCAEADSLQRAQAAQRILSTMTIAAHAQLIPVGPDGFPIGPSYSTDEVSPHRG